MKRVGKMGEDAKEENDRMIARLLDLENAYPRVSKLLLWMLLHRYGLKSRMLETLVDLHETTEYKMCGKEDMCWEPARGVERGL